MKRDQIEEPEVELTPMAKRVVDFVLRIKISTAVKATGLSGTAFYNIKSGRNNASLDVIHALAKAFPNDPEASFSWLHDGIMPSEATKPNNDQPINPGNASDEYNALKEAYDQALARVETLEKWNEELREDKTNLLNQMKMMWNNLGKSKMEDDDQLNTKKSFNQADVVSQVEEAKTIEFKPRVHEISMVAAQGVGA